MVESRLTQVEVELSGDGPAPKVSYPLSGSRGPRKYYVHGHGRGAENVQGPLGLEPGLAHGPFYLTRMTNTNHMNELKAKRREIHVPLVRGKLQCRMTKVMDAGVMRLGASDMMHWNTAGMYVKGREKGKGEEHEKKGRTGRGRMTR